MKQKSVRLVYIICILSFPLCIACKAGTQTNTGAKISSSEIVKKISRGENVRYKDVTITGDIDFTSIVEEHPESEGIFRSQINSAITFLNCTFEGKVTAFRKDENRNAHCVRFSENLTFINIQFKEELNFKEAYVIGLCSFNKSVFNKQSNFEGAYFLFKDVYFSGTLFKDKAKFQRAVFNGNANFLKAEFENTVSFQKAIFKSIAQFGAVKFNGYADFSNTYTYKGYIFNYAEFTSKAILSNSAIFNRCDMNDCVFKDEFSGKNSKFYCTLNLNRAKIYKTLNLENTIFFIEYPETQDLELKEEAVIILEGSKVNTMAPLNKNDFIKNK